MLKKLTKVVMMGVLSMGIMGGVQAANPGNYINKTPIKPKGKLTSTVIRTCYVSGNKIKCDITVTDIK